MERNGVNNFIDSNIENKMKSFNIFWEIISVKLIKWILFGPDPDLGDGYWYIDMGDSIILSSFSFTIFSSRFTEFP